MSFYQNQLFRIIIDGKVNNNNLTLNSINAFNSIDKTMTITSWNLT